MVPRLTMREQIIMRISLRDDVLLRWPSCEDYSARLSLPSKQKGGGSNPSGRAELPFYQRKRWGNGGFYGCGGLRQLLTGSASPSAQEQVVCLYGPGRGVPRPDSYSAQRADNWRSHSPPAATRMLEPREVVVVISTGWMCVLEGGRLPARHRRSPAARHEMGPVHLVRHTSPGRHGRKSRPCHRRGRY